MKSSEAIVAKIKYRLRRLTEKPLLCFTVSASILIFQYYLLAIIPLRFVGAAISILLQFSSIALCSKAIVFAADACSFKTMLFLFMVYFIMVLIVLVSIAGVVVMRFLGA